MLPTPVRDLRLLQKLPRRQKRLRPENQQLKKLAKFVCEQNARVSTLSLRFTVTDMFYTYYVIMHYFVIIFHSDD